MNSPATFSVSSNAVNNNPLIIGLTGGIGSGKSAVAELLVSQGAALVDTDLIARQLTAPNALAIEAIKAAFGPESIQFDGALDRHWMRERVFKQPQEKHRLEVILHPLIQWEVEQQVKNLAATAPYIVIAIPLLAESGHWLSKLHRVLLVDCPVALQIARVVQFRGLAADTVEAIVAQQAHRNKRLAVAHDIVFNGGTLQQLVQPVLQLHSFYLKLANHGSPPSLTH